MTLGTLTNEESVKYGDGFIVGLEDFIECYYEVSEESVIITAVLTDEGLFYKDDCDPFFIMALTELVKLKTN